VNAVPLPCTQMGTGQVSISVAAVGAKQVYRTVSRLCLCKVVALLPEITASRTIFVNNFLVVLYARKHQPSIDLHAIS